MEDPGILVIRRIWAVWRSWPIVRKSQLIGALAGGALTIGVQFLIEAFGSGESLIGLMLVAPWHMILWPALKVSRLFGWVWHLDTVYGVSGRLLCLMVLLNSLICLLAGSVVGVVLKLARRWRKVTTHE